MKLASVHYKNKIEPIWHVQLAVLLAIGMQIILNHDLTIGPKYLIALFEVFLLFSLAVIKPKDKPGNRGLRHTLALLLIAVVSVANLLSLILVIHGLLIGNATSGRSLIGSAVVIYITNIVIFGLWYWELDSDGVQNQSPKVRPIDFLFPQMRLPADSPIEKNWTPSFFDYVYISVTNAVAFSPNDTVPLTHRAKLLMTLQSLISVVTVALVVTRAVTILA